MPSTLETLFATIEARKEGSPETSYTARLFAMGENEICKKIGEEAVEVIVAAKGETEDRIIYEMADWVYHAMVLLALRGLAWEDVEKELARRFK
jgi:phosphoribosyl-ATP pyrophosphohydrolase